MSPRPTWFIINTEFQDKKVIIVSLVLKKKKELKCFNRTLKDIVRNVGGT